ncbi:MAG: PEP-CTERM/exosortase system-associated acyltransferase [Pseudomonadales bacterium]|nr:PEP-CTERM/exosortase system-associated acyltransferase [Pseudomonadales bacterium]
MPEANISELFDSYFEIVYAHSEALRDETYKIRYDVYCRELAFEDESAFPDKMERDETDSYSHHYLIKHRRSGMYAGTVRVVDPNLTSDAVLCPIEQYCSESITDEVLNPVKLANNTYCEVSRLAVPDTFRRRTGEKGKPFIYEGERISMTETEKKAFPYIAVGLYLAAAAHFINSPKLSHIFVMMEPRLSIHLRRTGIDFRQIGEVVEYHGERAPFHIDKERLLGGMNPMIRALYDCIETSICAQVSEHTPELLAP